MKLLPSTLARLGLTPEQCRAAKRDVSAAVKQVAKNPGEDWEGKLLAALTLWGLPAPTPQYRWHTPANGFREPRQYRADFAYPHLKILVEVAGGIYKTGENAGGHTRGAGFEYDRQKFNAAQIGGWIVLEFGPKAIASGEAITVIEAALKARGYQE